MPSHEVASKWFPDFIENGLPSSVSGKVFVITGTTSGTGWVAARTVAAKGGTALLLNRASSRVETATQTLKEAVPDGDFVNIVCDLQDFASVKAAAQEVKKKYSEGIYCLACNAGISHSEDKATKDGCDLQMQTNHLSHFILTAELYPLLEKVASSDGDARIVYHASGARHMTRYGKAEKEYYEKKGGDLGGNANSMFFGGGRTWRYAQSKLANVLLTHALANKLAARDSHVKVCCAHPGFAATSLGDTIELPWYESYLIFPLLKLQSQSAEDGTMGLLTGMMAETAQSATLYGPLSLLSTRGPAIPNPPKPYETDAEGMQIMWETSEASTGVKFDV